MIQLKSDCLIFQTNDGDQVPCSAEWVTLELMGEGAQLVDPEVVRHASAAVLHYFKHELQRQHVSVGEFAVALEKVLRGFGLSVYADHESSPEPKDDPRAGRPILDSNLRQIAGVAAEESFELLFFPQLREEVKRQISQSPRVVRFNNLRECVKHLSGSTRWNRRCQALNDQIVEFLRGCWQNENAGATCSLVVQ